MQRVLRVTIFLAILTLFGVMSFLKAQTARQSSQNKPGGQPEQSWFYETGLKIGDPFPEISLFDATGKPFNTRSLKGQYTVLINGCLT